VVWRDKQLTAIPKWHTWFAQHSPLYCIDEPAFVREQRAKDPSSNVLWNNYVNGISRPVTSQHGCMGTKG